jgi:MYXO-CTERM domain-containing protein
MKLTKLMASLGFAFAAQATSAATITVIIDDFNGTGTSMTGLYAPFSSSGLTAGGAYTSASTFTLAYVQGGYFNLAVGTNALTTGTLSYNPGINYNYFGGTNGQVLFTLADTDQAGGIVNGHITPIIDIPATIIYQNAYTNNASIDIVFNSAATKAWDVAIDNVSVSFDCAAARDNATLSLSQYLSIAENQSSAGICTPSQVPLPGSLGLLGLGGLAAGFVSRRRVQK